MSTTLQSRFFGYRLPDCTRSEDDYRRLLCEDLDGMSAVELEAERSILLHALGRAGNAGDARMPYLPTPGGDPVRFDEWARYRLREIGKRLRGAAAA